MEQGQRLQQYLMLEKIGDGGMAEVWKAKHQHLDHLLAVKFLKAEFAAHLDLQRRFLEEGKRQAGLNHPNIVRALDFIEEDGRQFLVMEYFDGGSIEDLVARPQPLPLDLVLNLTIPVLSALDFAHQRMVVHRDVKPSNILLDSQQKPHLTDFGIALALGGKRLTQAGTRMGTCEYMSPEQINRPALVGGRSDLYSVGIVLYQMLAGRLPFDADSGDIDFIIKQRHLEEKPRPLRDWVPELAPAVEAVVLRALEKDPEARFATAAEMARALQNAAAGMAATPPPVPAPVVPPQPPAPAVSPPPMPAAPLPAAVTPPPAMPAAPLPAAVTPPPPRSVAARPGNKRGLMAVLGVLALAIGGGAVALLHRGGGGTGTGGATPHPIELPGGPTGATAPLPLPPPTEPPAPRDTASSKPPEEPPKAKVPPPVVEPKPKIPPPAPTVDPPKETPKEPPVLPEPPKKTVEPVLPPPARPKTEEPARPPGGTGTPPPPAPAKRIEIFRPNDTGGGGAPNVAPRTPPEPAAPKPMSGVFVWALKLRKNETYTLEGNQVSAGVLQSFDPFPGEVVNVDVIGGARLDKDIAIIDQPSRTNGYRRLAIRSLVNRDVVLRIQWKRLDFGH